MDMWTSRYINMYASSFYFMQRGLLVSGTCIDGVLEPRHGERSARWKQRPQSFLRVRRRVRMYTACLLDM